MFLEVKKTRRAEAKKKGNNLPAEAFQKIDYSTQK